MFVKYDENKTISMVLTLSLLTTKCVPNNPEDYSDDAYLLLLKTSS